MKDIQTGRHVIDWMLDKMGGRFSQDAIGFGLVENGAIIAAAAFDVYRPCSNSIECAMAFDKPVTRRFLRECACFVYQNLGVNRAQAVINLSNLKSINTTLRLGFTIEGLLRQGGTNGEDAVIMGLLRDECRWIHHNYQLSEVA